MAREEARWSVPVGINDVPPEGRQFVLSADRDVRATVARLLGVIEVPRLDVRFDIHRTAGDGLRVEGDVSATVTQACVVTLEPVSSEVNEAVELVFLPGGVVAPAGAQDDTAFDEADPPEAMPAGGVDLAAIATEFLQLGLDPYPRKPDAAFEAPTAGEGARGENSPFAALAALKKPSV